MLMTSEKTWVIGTFPDFILKSIFWIITGFSVVSKHGSTIILMLKSICVSAILLVGFISSTDLTVST